MLNHRGTAIAAGLLTLVLASPARPAAERDELVVYSTRLEIAVELDRTALRIDLERYVQSLHASLRDALTEQAKARRPAPQIEVASVAGRPRG